MALLPTFGRLRRITRFVRQKLPSLNFITLHYTYFIATCLLGSLIFWGACTPPRSISYVDCLFLTVSAMTLAGLNTVNLSTLNTFQQFELFFLIVIGSAIFVSAFVVYVRKRAFEKRFDYVAELRRRRVENGKRSLPRSSSLAGRLSRSLTRSENQGIVLGPIATLPKKAKDSIDEQSVVTALTDPVEEAVEQEYPRDQQRGTNESVSADILPTEEAPAALVGSSVPNTSALEQDPHRARSSSTPRASQARTLTYRSDTGDEILVAQAPVSSQQSGPPTHITFGPDTYYHAELSPTRRRHNRFITMQGVGAQPNASIKRRPTNQSTGAPEAKSENALELATNHLPFTSAGYVSRNSQFHHFSQEERENLGGYEYRAVGLLSWLVPLYFFLFQLLGCLGLGAYVAYNGASTAQENGLNPWWVGSFNAVSAFNNSGMSLLDANMVAFQTSVYMLLTMGLLILAGNTCYPIILRLIVWSFFKALPENERWEDWRKTLQFLLDHPRRCYTNMFPSRHTWWLLSSVICLNGIDWAAFEILNLGNDLITSLPKGIEILDGLFQAFAVRSGGFYVVPIPNVRISLQVLYVIMMYISVYPVVITMRNSNVYEERSLGIYADDPGYGAVESKSANSFFSKLRRSIAGKSFEQTKAYFVRQQLRAQLAHDLWWVVLAVFLVMIVEGSNFQRDPIHFSVFNVVFEVVSGYGCVGISVGLQDENYSFCGAWHPLSKLILCAVMIRGRHRGLPVAIDKAVLLPGEALYEAEEEDAQIRLERTVSRGRVV